MESILADAVTSILKIVARRATEELTLALGFKDDLTKLVEKLQMIQSTLLYSGVENWSSHKPISSPVQLWLKKVQRIAYDAEYIFDLLAYEKVRRGLGSKIPLKRRVWFFFSSSNPIIFRQSMAHRINRVIKAIQKVERDAHTVVNITAAVAGAGTSYSGTQLPTRGFRLGSGSAEGLLKQTREHVDLHNIIGRDRDEAFLVDKLCRSFNPDNDHISVIAVVGVGGIGKSRLAKNVFEDKRVTDTFSQRIWIVVSEDFNIVKMLLKILEYVDMKGKKIASCSEVAVRKLKEKLDGKRYLLVLDDVWNTHQGLWNAMKSSLESIGGSKESMILVTARDKIVAQTMHATSIHELSGLSEDDSWSLFEQVALAKMSVKEVSMLETTGKKIVRKCKGNPLAINTIGGILQTKHHSYEWENIERSEFWDLPQDDDTGILPSLKLSYNHLPSPFLKKCFSFCAVIPKDSKIDKLWLKCHWMALGLIQQLDSRELMEDIAEGYINLLLNISFLQEIERYDLGDTQWYVMHDLVHDLATSVSRHEVLLLEDGKQVTTISDVRYVAMFGHMEVTSDFWDKLVVENLRSLYIVESLPSGLLEYVKYLRALDLHKVGLENVPKSIAGLKCLKYLRLAYFPMKVLPEFITELYNLQILSLSNCERLKELPRGLDNLVNLRHLFAIRIIEVPAGMIQQLRCLQTLPPLRVRDGGFQISELGYLPNVSGDLEIHDLEVVKSKQDAESARILEKSRVEKLKLSWNSDNDWVKHEEVLDGLKPNRNLRLLEIQGYGGEKFPTWIMRMGVFYNLVRIIEFSDCRRCQKLPTLGNLPSLEMLEIKNMDSLEHIGAEFYCNADEVLTEDASSSSNFGVVYFPSLKKLRLCGLQNLREWGEPCSGVRSSMTFFPSLEELVMEDCPEMTTSPNKFPSLTKLTVINNTSGLPVLNILDNESSLVCLKNLHIDKVVELRSLSQKLTEYCTSLQTLRIDNCQNLTCLPERLSKLVSLELLHILYCSSLESLPNLSSLASLRRLQIFCNDNLKLPPEDLQCCTSLEELWLSNCPKIETLPDLTALTRLTILCIVGMTKMMCQLPDWIYSLPCLQVLHIGKYFQLFQFPDISPILKITSLTTLLLYGWENQDADISLPEQLQHFKTLQHLQIVDFESLECLPDWTGNLSSLQQLVLSRCKKLKKLAAEDAMKRLSKLRYLEIENCPLLEEAIKINGTEHHKISHIELAVTTE